MAWESMDLVGCVATIFAVPTWKRPKEKCSNICATTFDFFFFARGPLAPRDGLDESDDLGTQGFTFDHRILGSGETST